MKRAVVTRMVLVACVAAAGAGTALGSTDGSFSEARGPVALVAPMSVGSGPECGGAPVFVHDGLGTYLRPGKGLSAGACSVQTGFQTSETRIAIGSTGHIVQQPAFAPNQAGALLATGSGQAGVAWSGDGGKKWELRLPEIQPAGVSHPDWSGQDTAIAIDPVTNRLFASAPQLHDQWLAYSDNEGADWQHVRPVYGVSSENPRFLFTRPRLSTLSDDYPNVVYWCTEMTVFATTAGTCYKSLDGGASWLGPTDGQGFTGSDVPGQPVHPECGSDSDNVMGPGNPGYPVSAPDGSLYLVVSCGTKHFLARSIDEGATWPVVYRAGQPLELTFLAGEPPPHLLADEAGGLYLIQRGGSLAPNVLLLRSSADRGATWSTGVNMAPPEVKEIGGPGFFAAARQPGRVAVAFGSVRKEPAAEAGWVDAWLSTTNPGAASTPVITSARLTTAKPVLWQARGNAPWPFLDFLGTAIGPDGSAYGSFIQDCGPALNEGVACAAKPWYNNTGLVGRLTPLKKK